jgi:hypothetical protein
MASKPVPKSTKLDSSGVGAKAISRELEATVTTPLDATLMVTMSLGEDPALQI